MIRSEQVVSTDQIMAEIWNENPPRRAVASLHVYVSQLRKFLSQQGSDGSQILTRAPGYLLTLGADTVDLHEFQRHMGKGSAALRKGLVREAERDLSVALATWRGPALGELVGEGPVLRGFVTWVEENRLECLDLLIQARFALGMYRQMIAPLYQHIFEHPLQESFYRQLMYALYQLGRQVDALRVYESAQATLATELGIEPCRALKDLRDAILVGDVRDDHLATAALLHG